MFESATRLTGCVYSGGRENSMDIATIAIIGGGPGGLMTAYRLAQRLGDRCRITLFESGDRLGGKIVTGSFEKAPVRYEAGAAELYDYTEAGPDPLREMVRDFGLTTRPMSGRALVLQGRIIRSVADLEKSFGVATAEAIRAFDRFARDAVNPTDYYDSDWAADNQNPLYSQSFADLLWTIPDPIARDYVRVTVHSDVATEPHSTTAMYGLQNYLMNEPGYMRLYTIDGGIERLTRELVRRIKADVKLHNRVTAVERTSVGDYKLEIQTPAGSIHGTYDFVVAALPLGWLSAVDWRGESLSRAMAAHFKHYDHPAHYLRVTVLFETPFWRPLFSESYFMLGAFGGCCVYDESSKSDGTTHGVLGWLIAGLSAMMMSNLDDATLTRMVLDSLPAELRHGRDLLIEAKVHRWIGSVNGLPGGYPVHEPDSRHAPDPENHPNFFLVGDYLFDSTLNGVLDSADTVAEWIEEEVLETADAVGG
jgi:monoamine oxidase